MDVDGTLARMYSWAPKMVPTDAQQMKLHAYETAYGIFDHDAGIDKDHPLALVLMHPAEQTHTPLFELMKLFKDRQIREHWGLSWPEFMAQPREICEWQLKISLSEQAKDVKDNTAQRKALEDLFGGTKS